MSEPAEQGMLFDLPPAWKEEWKGMPSFNHDDLEPYASVLIHFKRQGDREAFSKMIGHYADRAYHAATPTAPKYPIYIVSKGRWESRLTSKSLDAMGVPYFIVVEEQEREKYAAVIDPVRVLILDPAYQRNYDPFDDLGDSKSKGPGPARNFAWDHAVASGASAHWVMDDNINGFYYFQKNLKTPVADGAILRAMEDFVDRYSNVAMSGPNYFMFVSRKCGKIPPFVLNTRIYSCNLIRNDVPFRWRGRYNEDTDLSLRLLKAGFCTVQFNAFLQYKMTTQALSGGNTAEFYAKEGTLAKSQMQVAMHPDVSRLVQRFGRWHHYVDYRGFRRNRLVLREGVAVSEAPDDYGMSLRVKSLAEGNEEDECEVEESFDAEPVQRASSSPYDAPVSDPAEPPPDMPAEVVSPAPVGKLKSCIDCGAEVPPPNKYRCLACQEKVR